jgi:DNA-binding SARP family transcriptional activator
MILSTSAGGRVSVCLLGGVRAWRDGAELALGPPQRRAVLAVLALAGAQPVSRAELVDVLWPEAPPARAVNIIQTHVKHLRQALEPARPSRAVSLVLPAVGGGYALLIDPSAVDVLRFRGMVARARDARRSADPARVCHLAREALRMWRTPVPDVPMLAHYPRIVALLAEWQLLIAWYADAAIEQGRADEVLPLLEEHARGRPLDEEIQVCLLRAYGALGRRADAFAFYDQARRRLAGELGVNAGHDLVAAYEALLHQDTSQMPDRARATDAAVARGRRAEATSGRPVPAQLPADLFMFTGRVGELAQLDRLLDDGGPGLQAAAIVGSAGVGKTALAVHWAHRVSLRFPDGQLHVDLGGTVRGPAVSPSQALGRLLTGLGVEGDRVPADREVAAALYRSLLDRTRTLLLLDDAASAAQVRPLLPGTPTCLTLVTSRDRLTGLVASHGVRRLTLDMVSTADARRLLVHMLGAARVMAEPGAAAELAELCARLPLALRIAAVILMARPEQSIAGYVAELRRDEALDGLTVDGDDRLAVRASFDRSYERLDAGAQRMFRLLGVIGDESDVAAAAAAAGVSPEEAAVLLDRLADAHLVSETAPGRFTSHRLLRLYAAEHAHGHGAV